MPNPRTLAEIQTAIAARISDFPPEQQTKIMEVAEYSYVAGFNAAKEEIAVASRALTQARQLVN